ncbi:MAG: Arc family DNA-binding protein [Silvanigrellaceae bacterium]|nr:Arc family DNA-binding protein [Silvanigrellaceae bacterium]
MASKTKIKEKIDLTDIRIRTATKDPIFTIRIPNELRRAIELEAKRNGRSTRSEISFRLAESIRNNNEKK